MAKRKLAVRGEIRVDAYKVIVRAVGEGVAYGVRRAFKHRDDCPDEAGLLAIMDQVEQAVMTELCEALRFDDAERE